MIAMTTTGTALAIMTIASGVFCRRNRLALFHHLVYFYPVSVSTFAFWNILGHDLLVPEITMSLFLFFSHFKHLDLLPKCGYLHTAGQGLPSLRR